MVIKEELDKYEDCVSCGKNYLKLKGFYEIPPSDDPSCAGNVLEPQTCGNCGYNHLMEDEIASIIKNNLEATLTPKGITFNEKEVALLISKKIWKEYFITE